MTKRTKKHRAKSRAFAGQQEGEEVILVARRFPIVLRRQLIVGMLMIVIFMLPWAIATGNDYGWLIYANWFLLLGILVLGFYWLRTWVSWYYTVYVLTSYRIMIVKTTGFFGREVSELALSNIQNVNYKIKGMQASVFGFGDVVVETLSGGEPLQLNYIHKPVQFQQAVLEVVRREGLDK